jgi:hypothetical protein
VELDIIWHHASRWILVQLQTQNDHSTCLYADDGTSASCEKFRVLSNAHMPTRNYQPLGMAQRCKLDDPEQCSETTPHLAHAGASGVALSSAFGMRLTLAIAEPGYNGL